MSCTCTVITKTARHLGLDSRCRLCSLGVMDHKRRIGSWHTLTAPHLLWCSRACQCRTGCGHPCAGALGLRSYCVAAGLILEQSREQWRVSREGGYRQGCRQGRQANCRENAAHRCSLSALSRLPLCVVWCARRATDKRHASPDSNSCIDVNRRQAARVSPCLALAMRLSVLRS